MLEECIYLPKDFFTDSTSFKSPSPSFMSILLDNAFENFVPYFYSWHCVKVKHAITLFAPAVN